MSKYKVGDRVVVIAEEELQKLVDPKLTYFANIKHLCGETVTIEKKNNDGSYKIKGYDGWLCDYFFKGLEEDAKRQYKHDEYLNINVNEAVAKFTEIWNLGLDNLNKPTNKKENNTMNKKDILAVRNYNDRAMVMQFDKKYKNNKNVQTRAEVHDGDTFDLDEGIRICLLKYLLGGHKEYMAIMNAARKSYKKSKKEDQKKAAEKYKKAITPVEKEAKKKEKRDKEIEELIAKAIKKALAETRESENKTVEE